MRWTVVRRHHAYTLRIISMLCVCVFFFCSFQTAPEHTMNEHQFCSIHYDYRSPICRSLWFLEKKKMRRKQIPRAIISNREIVICATEKKNKLNRNRNTKHAEIKAKIIDGTYCELVFKGLKCAIIHSWFKLSQSICWKKHVKQE